MDNNSATGIYLTQGSTGVTLQGNEASFNAYGWERNANGIDVRSPGNTIIKNVVHDNEDSGIQFYPGGNNNVSGRQRQLPQHGHHLRAARQLQPPPDRQHLRLLHR